MAVASAAGARRVAAAGLLARGAVLVAVLAGVLSVGLVSEDNARYAITAVIYAIVGLSLNVIIGYVGQLSLGHQGFVGAGALFAAYAATNHGMTFGVALVFGALAGAAFALLLGFVALRIRGLYLALITLVFGLTLQASLFNASALTGGGAGEPANRPSALQSNHHYYYVCLGVLALVIYLDVRVSRSKAGRAFAAIKENELVAAAFGVDVVAYKLLAFVLSGTFAGLAGGLFAFASQQFNGNDFSFQLALTFVLMTVVGGAGDRVGVVLGSVLFALLHTVLSKWSLFQDFATSLPSSISTNMLQFGPDVVGALLLLVTLAVNPGGIAQGIAPLTRWLRGQPFSLHAPASSVREGARDVRA